MTAYTVNPALPAGLNLDPTSGVISGTPTTTSVQATYTVTGSNGSGHTTFGLVLTVIASGGGGGTQAPSGLSYSSPLTATVNVALTVAPSVSGSLTAYTVNPALPAGLNLDPTSGVISGTPTMTSVQATYTVMASNGGGHTTFGLVLTVTASGGGGGTQAPSGLSYSSPVTAVVGVPFSSSPTVFGSVTSYSVAPSLPTGLSLDRTSGTISGTPSSAAPKAAYVVTASNNSGSTTFTLSLAALNPAAPSNLAYVNPAPPFLVGVGTLNLTPTVTGQVTQYSITPALPAGLAISASTGVIYSPPNQAPSAPTAKQNYTVTAANVTGSTNYVLSLEVDSGPTILLSATALAPIGGTLTYYWRTTDGQLVDANGSAVTQPSVASQPRWVLPQGRGLHFAYLLVSDGQGNCSESRLVINSDSFGAPNPKSPADAWPTTNYLGIKCALLTDLFFVVTASSPNAALPSVTCPGQFNPQSSMVCSMSATYNGQTIGVTQQVFPGNLMSVMYLPNLSEVNLVSEPSNAEQPANFFLTYTNNENTVFDACDYYRNIGAFGNAMATCDDNGNVVVSSGTLMDFAAWQTRDQIARIGINTGKPPSQSPAYYVNVVDLGLTREHHSTVYQDAANNNAPSLATYVCNYPGPTDTSNFYPGSPMTVNPSLLQPGNTGLLQQSVDNAVGNAVGHSGLIGCVAMDYITIGGNQYTRFYVFGPGGGLLPSLNLDGRGEKYVPGACIACHGGYTFSNTYYHQNSGGNLGAYFLPYDIYNFAFSDQTSPVDVTALGQAGQIEALNKNLTYAYSAQFNGSATAATLASSGILTVMGTVTGRIAVAQAVMGAGMPFATYVASQISGTAGGDGTYQLVNVDGLAFPSITIAVPIGFTGNPISTGTANLTTNWYASGSAPNFNFDYVPPAWNSGTTVTGPSGTAYTISAVYSSMVARSCRTCHTAQPDSDWDSYSAPNTLLGFASIAYSNICDQQSMPNTITAFDRFWDSHLYNLSSATPLESLGPDQVDAFLALYITENPAALDTTCAAP